MIISYRFLCVCVACEIHWMPYAFLCVAGYVYLKYCVKIYYGKDWLKGVV
jgi:hypothetical protein